MNAGWEIGPFREEDVGPVVGLWRQVLPDHHLSEASLERYTFSHPDFDPAGGLVARSGGRLIGFALATDMRISETDLQRPVGCIPVLMVHPDHRQAGIGSALLHQAETYLKARGYRKIVAGYPTYVRSTALSLIGIDARWKQSLWFFRHFGFQVTGILDSAKVSLEGFQIPPRVLEAEAQAAREDITAGVLTADETGALLHFLDDTFPGAWHRQFAKRIPQRQVIFDNVVVLRQAGKIVGFVGPFDIPESGVASLGAGIGLKPQLRGRGLGNVILFRALQRIRDAGARECYIFGVGPKRYYDNAGFRMAELWILLDKPLDP